MFKWLAKWRMRRLEKKLDEWVKKHPCTYFGHLFPRTKDEKERGPKTTLALLSVAEQMEKCDEGKLIPLITDFPLRTPTIVD